MSARRSLNTTTVTATTDSEAVDAEASHTGAAEAPPTSGRARARGSAVAAATATLLAASLLPGLSGRADAATIEARALSIAASKHGDPYRWGAAGPRAFDCSGLTYYSFKHAGRALPRTAQQQYDHVRHIPASQVHTGDLVFFHYGSSVYHVGIYAGHHRIWNAPHTGAVVRLERIWSRSVWYGRIR